MLNFTLSLAIFSLFFLFTLYWALKFIVQAIKGQEPQIKLNILQKWNLKKLNKRLNDNIGVG